MLQPKTRWKVADSQPEEAAQLAEETGISTMLAQLLLNRGIRTAAEAEQFLYTEGQPFYDPYLMAGMKTAVERIRKAVENSEKILVFGDYDADGVTSTSIMMVALQEIGAKAEYYIPNRFREGYGLNESALRQAKEAGAQLVVTVDTGITAVDEAETASQLGIDLIITDHHQPPPVLPDAYCLINPHQEKCPYPFKELSGAGVAFKVAHALLGKVPRHLLDLTALGTIADLVPLNGENRLIAIRGIAAMRTSEKPGIRALLKVASLHERVVTAEDVGFALGPRLNAAGRLDSADPAVRLLLAEEEEEAKDLAEEVNFLNQKRKTLVKEMADEAIVEIEGRFLSADDDLFVIAKQGWNPGVIGIVASRIVERYHRPAIVMGIDPETGLAKGSARSIEGFDMFQNLSACRDLLPHFGGHPMAAGMTLKRGDIETLRARLNELARETLKPEDFSPVKHADFVCKAGEVTLEAIEEMQKLAPFGTANPTPKIVIADTPLTSMKQIGSDKNHLKTVFAEEGAKLEGIGFRLGHFFRDISGMAKVSAVGEMQVNEWNGFRKPQLVIEDLAVREWQLFDLRNGRDLKERLGSLPEDKRVFISFREATAKHPDICQWGQPACFISDEIPNRQDFSGHYVILLDMPFRKEQLRALFENAPMPERIYAVFHHHEDRSFITAPPSRNQFKWFYAFLLQRKSFDIKRYADQLARAKGLSKETVTFMADVFSELGFVSNDNGMLTLNEKPTSRDLTESLIYRERQQQASLESDLCYSSYSSLKQWFDEINNQSKQLEGAVN